MSFPIDLKSYTPLRFSLAQTALSEEQRSTLQANITLIRDSLIFFTAYANVKGLGGHTGGAFDIVPELLIVDGFIPPTRRAGELPGLGQHGPPLRGASVAPMPRKRGRRHGWPRRKLRAAWTMSGPINGRHGDDDVSKDVPDTSDPRSVT